MNTFGCYTESSFCPTTRSACCYSDLLELECMHNLIEYIAINIRLLFTVCKERAAKVLWLTYIHTLCTTNTQFSAHQHLVSNAADSN